LVPVDKIFLRGMGNLGITPKASPWGGAMGVGSGGREAVVP